MLCAYILHKGKPWKHHYRLLLRVLRKGFGKDEMDGMSLYYNYSLNGDINSNEIGNCNKLDDSTIEKLWNILNDNNNNNNNASTMSFIISKSLYFRIFCLFRFFLCLLDGITLLCIEFVVYAFFNVICCFSFVLFMSGSEPRNFALFLGCY